MKKNWFLGSVLALAVSFLLVPGLAAQESTYEGGSSGGGMDIGLQAATNFDAALVGMKLQLTDLAITPRLGFLVQPLKHSAGTIFSVGFGCDVDYYVPGWAQGKLRPYIGGGLLFYVSDMGKGSDTGFWVILDPHIGAEYWLSDRFSVGGNLGLSMGFGETSYSPDTIGAIAPAESNFGFGVSGKLHITYYF